MLGSVIRGTRALERQFPHVDTEALQLFIDSCGGQPDAETVAALAEMQSEAQSLPAGRGPLASRGCTLDSSASNSIAAGSRPLSAGQLELRFDGGASPPHVDTILLMTGIASARRASAATSGGPISPPVAGKVLPELPFAVVVIPSGEVLALEEQEEPVRFWVREYGMHELRFVSSVGTVKRCRFMVSSHLGEFAEALDHLHDAYDWAWDGQWTEELEEASVALIVTLDDHFTTMNAMFQKNMMMGEALRSTLDPFKSRFETYLAKAIEQHDPLAVGRAVSAVRGLLLAQSLFEMFGPMLGGSFSKPLGESCLYQGILAFEAARLAATSEQKRAELKATISRLVQAADAHVAALHDDGSAQDLVQRWRTGIREQLVAMISGGDGMPANSIHPLPFLQLRGGGSGYMTDMMASMSDAFLGAGAAQDAGVKRAATTEALSTLSSQISFAAAEAKVSRWDESLVDESVQFGSPLQPFEVHAAEPWVQTVCAALQSILSLGFGYVTQGKEGDTSTKLVALLDRNRAALPLDSEDDFLSERRRRDRLKDVCRIVRAAKKRGQRLVLSVNTDFSGAVHALREHHSDSWVSSCLEAVWAKMRAESRVFAFELWLHEAASASSPPPAPKLIAADFGHPHTNGQAYYVATRFFDREFRTLQPGFILAFAEAACLKRAGFALWDLGGADASPMMQYKPQVAIEMGRSEFIRRLRELGEGCEGSSGDGTQKSLADRRRLSLCDPGASLPAGGEKVPTGIVFDDIGEADLWGTAVLKEREAAAKPLPKAGKKQDGAAGKQAKPSKTSKPRGAAATISVVGAVEAKPALPVFAPPGRTETQQVKEQPGAVGSHAGGPSLATTATSMTSTSSPSLAASAAATAAKEEVRRRFAAVFQQLIAEGLPHNEAAAKALQRVATANA